MRDKNIHILLVILFLVAIGTFFFTVISIYFTDLNNVDEKYVYPPFSSDHMNVNDTEPSMVISSEDGPPLTMPDQSGALSLVVKEAFRRVGVNVIIITVPAERGLQNVQNGITDGDYTRIAGLEKYYPNMVMVPEKLLNYNFVAFTKNRNIELKGWDSLKPYSVGFVTGWKMIEQNVANVKSVIGVRDEKLLFELLKKDRVDIIIHSKQGGEYLVEKMQIKDVRILEPSLAVKPMYLYLNKKHKSIVSSLVSSLRSMKSDGTYDRFMNSF